MAGLTCWGSDPSSCGAGDVLYIVKDVERVAACPLQAEPCELCHELDKEVRLQGPQACEQGLHISRALCACGVVWG